eukprot:270436_1
MMSKMLNLLSLTHLIHGKTLPNIEKASLGYNIIYGNPHTTGTADRGWFNSIFNLSVFTDGTTITLYNNTYNVPNGMTITGESTCDMTQSYSALSGANSYSSSLQESVDFDVKVWKAAFQGSEDYQKVARETSSSQTAYTSSCAKCGAYEVQLNAPYGIPPFTENFMEAVTNMPLSYDQATQDYFLNFLDKYFGTHYLLRIFMGGIYGQLSEFNANSFSSFSSSNLSISMSASYSTLFASASVSAMTNIQKQQAQDFKQSTMEQHIFQVGGDLPSDGSPITWQKSLFNEPMPMWFQLDNIYNIINSYNFPTVDPNVIAQKSSALHDATLDYCNQLANTSLKIQCDGYPNDPPLPVTSIFGGIYSYMDCEDSSVQSANRWINPYTGSYNCPVGFTTKQIGEFVGYPISKQCGMVYQYLCINMSAPKLIDPMKQFGGIYQYNTANTPKCCDNPLIPAGIDTYCPDGFKSYQISQIATVYTGNWTNYVWGSQFWCYNTSVALVDSIIGGFYQVGSSKGNLYVNNQYTLTTTCPQGFKPFQIGSVCADNFNYGNVCNSTMAAQIYVCLSNIYSYA